MKVIKKVIIQERRAKNKIIKTKRKRKRNMSKTKTRK
jgi:hypothetical protein